MAKVNLTQFTKQLDHVKDLANGLADAALQEFIKNTPIRSGNARRNTRVDNTTIVANYPYSQKLDEGYSKQAPNGMTEPTEKWIQQEVDRRLKGIK